MDRNKMFRLMALLVVIAMVVGACGATPTATPVPKPTVTTVPPTATKAPIPLTAVPVAPTVQPTAVLVATSSEVITAVWLLAESPTDQGWNAAAYRGISLLKTLGQATTTIGLSFDVKLTDGRTLRVKVVENVGYDDAKIEGTLRQVLNEKPAPNIVFGTWYNALNAFAKLANEFPNVLFEHDSGYPEVKSNGKNFATYFIRQEEGDYVAGYVVGLMGYDKVGLVGTIPIPEPVRAVNAFQFGMQRGLVESGKDASKATLDTVWINAWLNVTDEQNAAQAFLDKGYKVIRQIADTPYSSQTACKKAGTIAVGYGTDVSSFAACAVVTNEWVWGSYYLSRINAVLNKTWKAGDWWGGFRESAVAMTGWGANVPADVKQKAEALVASMKLGKNLPFCGPFTGYGKDKSVITVPAGKCLDDMSQLTMQWYATGVSGPMPDKPANGYLLNLVDAPK